MKHRLFVFYLTTTLGRLYLELFLQPPRGLPANASYHDGISGNSQSPHKKKQRDWLCPQGSVTFKSPAGVSHPVLQGLKPEFIHDVSVERWR